MPGSKIWTPDSEDFSDSKIGALKATCWTSFLYERLAVTSPWRGIPAVSSLSEPMDDISSIIAGRCANSTALRIDHVGGAECLHRCRDTATCTVETVDGVRFGLKHYPAAYSHRRSACYSKDDLHPASCRGMNIAFCTDKFDGADIDRKAEC